MLIDFHGRYIDQCVGNRTVFGDGYCGLFGNWEIKGNIRDEDRMQANSIKV